MALGPAAALLLPLLATAVLAATPTLTAQAPGPAASRCVQCQGTCNEELGRCDCPRGFSGPGCAAAAPPSELSALCKSLWFKSDSCGREGDEESPCVNACNKRGRCMSGFCLCEPGFFGADCSLSLDSQGKPQLLQGLGYSTRSKRPHIYVYELPPKYNTWFNLRAQDRPLNFMFQQRLLSSGARTADGEAADYFLIPVSLRGPSDSLLLMKAIRYIRTTWPWWNRTSGSRHLLIQVGDTGRGDVLHSVRQATLNCTYLQHWGLVQDYPLSNWKAAHRPGLDIVVPIYISPTGKRAGVFKASSLHPRSPPRTRGSTSTSPVHTSSSSSSSTSSAGPGAGAGQQEGLELLFAGRICGGGEAPQPSWPNCPLGRSKGYSQGVRQAVHWHHWNRTGFSVSTTHPRYMEALNSARFCLAPTGGGHGHRQTLVALAGCVPLLIGDHVLQPFEPELDWTRFSVSLPQDQIPRLHLHLAAVEDTHFTAMQATLGCAAQHLTYSSFIGGFRWNTARYDAFETTLEILRSRLLHPGAPPSELRQLDPQLAAFMECREPQEQAPAVPQHQPRELCSLSRYDADAFPCEPCLRRYNGIIPGGAPCCGAASLAACPRDWP